LTSGGPRPLLVEYIPYYTEDEHRRHDVRPGLSGLAQVNGRNASSWQEKFDFDLEYVQKITFFGDIKIVLLTIKKAIKRSDILVGSAIPAGRLDEARLQYKEANGEK
jgi:lipopolysaccharide/colanic/teichoic acid biosynthesis glycosyltransferase